MRIKVFKAPTMKEAMANVKAELGDDAVILHTKRYRKGGLMGFRSKEIIEIIAAVEDKPIEERVNVAATSQAELPEGRLNLVSNPEPADGKAEPSPQEDSEPVIEPKPRPVMTPRSAVNQYQTAGTAAQVRKAQEEADDLHRGAKTIEDVMENMRQQQNRPYDARTIAAKGENPSERAQEFPAKPQWANIPVYGNHGSYASNDDVVPDYDYPPPDGDYPIPDYDSYYRELEQEQANARAEKQKKEELEKIDKNIEEQEPSEDQGTEPQEITETTKTDADQVVDVTDTPSDMEAKASESQEDKLENVKDAPEPEKIDNEKEISAAGEKVSSEEKEEIKQPDEDAEDADEVAVEPSKKKRRTRAKKEELPQEDDFQLAADPDDDGKDEQIQQLQYELEKMRVMLTQAMTGENKDNKITNLQVALRRNDVDDKVIQDMISRLTGAEIVADKDSRRAVNALEKYLRKTVRVATGITLLSGRPKIVALIGPTGVGKTTTLAKIAANFVLDKGVSAAMITADTYRISAVEQLKTYSDIIGLPLEIVYSPDALKKAIEKHRNKQLILIDTAGRSQYNDYQMQELCELLSVDKNIEKHLVMSATTKNRDAEEILERFLLCKPDRIIFTKTDETSCPGIVLNIMHKKKIALAYLTNGQSVPDDIYPASIEKLAELLLR